MTPLPDFHRTSIASGGDSAFLSTPARLTLTRQASQMGSDDRGRVLFPDSHEATAALLNGFYNRCRPRATPVVETVQERCSRFVRIREQHPATIVRAHLRCLPRQSQARGCG